MLYVIRSSKSTQQHAAAPEPYPTALIHLAAVKQVQEQQLLLQYSLTALQSDRLSHILHITAQVNGANI